MFIKGNSLMLEFAPGRHGFKYYTVLLKHYKHYYKQYCRIKQQRHLGKQTATRLCGVPAEILPYITGGSWTFKRTSSTPDCEVAPRVLINHEDKKKFYYEVDIYCINTRLK